MSMYAVINDQSGRARIGTIDVDPSSISTGPPKRIVKKEKDRSDPHHPENNPVLLKVSNGEHLIVTAGNGKTEDELPLTDGDFILFADFKPEKPPADNLRFSYSGHWSQPGVGGVTLEPAEVNGEVDLGSWKPID